MDAQGRLHLIDTNGTSIASHLVHHIDGKHHGLVEFQELHREIEVAFDVGGIDDVEDGRGVLVEDESTRDDLLCRIGRKGIDAGEVGNLGIGIATDDARLPVDGNAGEVAHVLVGTGELVEERCLAAVLIAGKGEGEQIGLLCDFPSILVLARGTPMLGCLLVANLLTTTLVFLVITTGLAETRVWNLVATRLGFGRSDGNVGSDFDLCGIGKAKCEQITAKQDLHRVAHWRILHKRDLDAWDDAHIEEMLTQCTLTAHNGDDGPMSYLEVL